MTATDPLVEVRQTLPDAAPAWASQVLQSSVTVSFATGDTTLTELARTKLLAARDAELQAIAELSAKLDALTINRQTVGELCELHPRVSALRDRTAAATKRQRIVYGDDEVTVVVELDAPAFWRAVSGRQVGR
ncbi:MAG: hypothetical protein AAGK78_09830 [Planctomycetota bacterium]